MTKNQWRIFIGTMIFIGVVYVWAAWRIWQNIQPLLALLRGG